MGCPVIFSTRFSCLRSPPATKLKPCETTTAQKIWGLLGQEIAWTRDCLDCLTREPTHDFLFLPEQTVSYHINSCFWNHIRHDCIRRTINTTLRRALHCARSVSPVGCIMSRFYSSSRLKDTGSKSRNVQFFLKPSGRKAHELLILLLSVVLASKNRSKGDERRES